MNLTILVGQRSRDEESPVIYSTNYSRWYKESRPHLFSTLAFTQSRLHKNTNSIPKVCRSVENAILDKVLEQETLARYLLTSAGSQRIFCHSGGRYFRKCIRTQLSNEYKEFNVCEGFGDAAICLLSSSLYYWFWIAVSDCYHVTKRDVDAFPVPSSVAEEERFLNLSTILLDDLWINAKRRQRKRADGTVQEEVNFYVSKSKAIIDEIDRVLAQHYGFTDDELDFIINYDIKYRMGTALFDNDG